MACLKLLQNPPNQLLSTLSRSARVRQSRQKKRLCSLSQREQPAQFLRNSKKPAAPIRGRKESCLNLCARANAGGYAQPNGLPAAQSSSLHSKNWEYGWMFLNNYYAGACTLRLVGGGPGFLVQR